MKFFSNKNNKNSSNESLTEIRKKDENVSKPKYPFYVYLIILTDLCERFSFYGIRNNIFIFLSVFLSLDSVTSTAIYHAFSLVCNFTPIIGALISDGFIGPYLTILSLAILYCIGEVVLMATSLPPLGAPEVAGPLIGLFIMGLGTGGIKPCVAAFGGEQFEPSQNKQMIRYFSIYYAMGNIASIVATILTPILISSVKCYNSSCYALAFGIPAALMLCAILSFVAGTGCYKKKWNQNKGKNIIIETIEIVFRAFKNRLFGPKSAEKKDLLMFADTHHSPTVIRDVQKFFRILFVFVPIPIFYSLYEQQGSRWTDQAKRLDNRIGSIIVQPAQMQAINPIFILILIPIFDYIIYPVCAKINLFKNLLQRMVAGMIFAVLAFLISAGLEWKMVQASNSVNPANQLRVLNLLPCQVDIYNQNGQEFLFHIDASVYLNNRAINLPNSVSQNEQLMLNYTCPNELNLQLQSIVYKTTSSPLNTLILYLNENNQNEFMNMPYDNSNPMCGQSSAEFESLNINSFGQLKPVLIESGMTYTYQSNPANVKNSKYTKMDVNFYDLIVKTDGNSSNTLLKVTHLYLGTCGKYKFLLFKNPTNAQLDYALLTDFSPINISIGWQVIQIFVLSVAEILLSISSITFTYSQAPKTMKPSCVTLRFIAVSLGDLIVLIAAEARLVKNQAWEFVFFAGLMAVTTVIFFFITLFYNKGRKKSEDDKDNINESKTKLSNQENINKDELILNDEKYNNLKEIDF